MEFRTRKGLVSGIIFLFEGNLDFFFVILMMIIIKIEGLISSHPNQIKFLISFNRCFKEYRNVFFFKLRIKVIKKYQ